MKTVRDASWFIGAVVFCIGASMANSEGSAWYIALLIVMIGIVIATVGCLIEGRYRFEDEDDLRYL